MPCPQRFKVNIFVVVQDRVEVVVPLCNARKMNRFFHGLVRMSLGVSQPEEWICSVVWWYSRGYFCISCQTAAG